MAHPELPSCADCQRWVYDANWERRCRGRPPVPLLRPQGSPTPCWKCPKKSPTSGLELSPKNWKAYMLYLRIKAGMPMPDDGIVQRNCSLCRMVEDAIERTQMTRLAALPTLFATKKR